MKVENGKVVKFSYVLKDGNGTLLDQSDTNGPLTYVHGMEMIIPGLEKKLESLKAGDNFDAIIPPTEGYGERVEENMIQYSKEAFGDTKDLQVGMQLALDTEYGEQIVSISKIDTDSIWLDANHPLAGVTLHFNGKIESVEEMTPEMLEQLQNHNHDHDCEGGCCGEHDHGCCGDKK